LKLGIFLITLSRTTFDIFFITSVGIPTLGVLGVSLGVRSEGGANGDEDGDGIRGSKLSNYFIRKL
jgi:hypothetical protein